MKRLLDLACALAIALPAGLCCLIAVWFIHIRDKQQPFFFQERVGLHERRFNMVKLRTMRVGTANVGTHEVSAEQITHVGKYLRRYKIDELPQIWNVVVGDMSFVGPRPCLPSQTFLIEERRRLKVFNCRPGITGLAQIRGIDMSTPTALARCDAEYMRNCNPFFDVVVLAKTLAGKGGGDRVMRE